MVIEVDIRYRIAIRDDIAPEAPGLAQMGLEQLVARAGRLPVHAVVSAHDRAGLRIDDRGAEGGQVGILHVVARDIDIGVVPGGFRAAVHGKVLGRRDDVGTLRVRPLKPPDEGRTDLRGQEWVFTIGFLPAAPAGITEDVDIGRPCVEPGADAPQPSGLPRERVQAPHLDTDDIGDILDQRHIEGGGEADWLGEVGRRQRAHRAMQRFRPPVVARDAKPRDCRSDIEQLVSLLLRRQLGNDFGGLPLGPGNDVFFAAGLRNGGGGRSKQGSAGEQEDALGAAKRRGRRHGLSPGLGKQGRRAAANQTPRGEVRHREASGARTPARSMMARAASGQASPLTTTLSIRRLLR